MATPRPGKPGQARNKATSTFWNLPWWIKAAVLYAGHVGVAQLAGNPIPTPPQALDWWWSGAAHVWNYLAQLWASRGTA